MKVSLLLGLCFSCINIATLKKVATFGDEIQVNILKEVRLFKIIFIVTSDFIKSQKIVTVKRLGMSFSTFFPL